MKKLSSIKKQKGVILITGLMILVLLAMIGLMGMRSGIVEQKMSGNLRDQSLSFEATESALKAGEDWVSAQTTQPTPATSCTPQPCLIPHDPSVFLENQPSTWWLNSSNTATFSSTLSNIATAPRYVIEYSHFVPDEMGIGQGSTQGAGKHYHYITARGTGGSNDSQNILQTTYSRRY